MIIGLGPEGRLMGDHGLVLHQIWVQKCNGGISRGCSRWKRQTTNTHGCECRRDECRGDWSIYNVLNLSSCQGQSQSTIWWHCLWVLSLISILSLLWRPLISSWWAPSALKKYDGLSVCKSCKRATSDSYEPHAHNPFAFMTLGLLITSDKECNLICWSRSWVWSRGWALGSVMRVLGYKPDFLSKDLLYTCIKIRWDFSIHKSGSNRLELRTEIPKKLDNMQFFLEFKSLWKKFRGDWVQ